jgi:peptidoglycan/LPS O-acetylase OafA/YrhL
MASSKDTSNHFQALDGWRGLCACLVALFHFHGYSPLYSLGLIRNSYLFVDFFFVLSGFVIAWNYADRLGSWAGVRAFLVLRVGRLYPLHIFVLFLFLALETAKLAMGHFSPPGPPAFTGDNQPGTVLSNIFLVQSLHLNDGLSWNGPSWSISTELWAYVVFALVSVTVGVRAWMLGLVALAAPLFLWRVTHTGMDITYDWGLVRCLFGFALGVACARAHRLRAADGAVASASLATLLECIALAAVVAFVSFAGTSDWSLLAPFVFALAVLVFAIEGGWLSSALRWPLFQWLGMLSYSIYLTHALVALVLPTAIKRLTHLDLWTTLVLPDGGSVLAYGRDNFEGTLFYALALGVTVAFSALTYRWVETPGRAWSRRWAGSTARTSAAEANGAPSAQLPGR